MQKITIYLDIEPVLAVLGSNVALAKVCQVERSSVNKWKNDGYIPEKHTTAVKQALRQRKREFDRNYRRVMK